MKYWHCLCGTLIWSVLPLIHNRLLQISKKFLCLKGFLIENRIYSLKQIIPIRVFYVRIIRINKIVRNIIETSIL